MRAARHAGRGDRPGRGPRALRRAAGRARHPGASLRRRPRPAEALAVAGRIGFPLLVRPSYVLGGRAMEICYSEEDLERYLERLGRRDDAGRMYPLLLDRFLENAIEIDVDALADGEDVYVAGIMQHVEEAGVHSGDSACVLPPLSLGEDMLAEVRRQTTRAGAAAGRDRASERAVRPRRQRPPARDRGEPARLAHGAVRLQGDRRAAREGGLPADPGRTAAATRTFRASRAAAT